MKQQNTINPQSGYTLIEVLVAMAIGAFLLSGTIQILNGNKHANRLSLSIAGLQENARYAIDVISTDLRAIGYQGCADPVGEHLVSTPATGITGGATELIPTGMTFPANALRGYSINGSGAWSPTIGSDINEIQTSVLPNTHVVTIQHANLPSVVLTSHGTVTDTLNVATTLGDMDGEIGIIASCAQAEIFTFTGDGATAYTTNGLSLDFTTGAQVMAFSSNTYFVANTTRTNPAGSIIPALFVRDANGNQYELIEGVENLQIRYGARLLSGNVHYLTAGDVNLNMTNVISLRIGLLMQSNQRALNQDDSRSYNVAGTTINASSGLTYNASDRLLRKTFGTTIRLRNRL